MTNTQPTAPPLDSDPGDERQTSATVKMQAQRDELAAALRWLLPPDADKSPAAQAARDALAKVQS